MNSRRNYRHCDVTLRGILLLEAVDKNLLDEKNNDDR